MTTRSPLPRARWRLLMAVLFAVLRVAIASAVVEISTIDHMVEELAAIAAGAHEGQDDHGCDERSCPPGCPTCHHHHSVVLPPSVPQPPDAFVPIESARLGLSPVIVTPPTRSVAPLERPPRLAG